MRPFSQVFDRTSGQVRQIVAEVQCPDPSRLADLQARSATEELSLSELGELLEIGRSPLAGRQFETLRSFVLGTRRKAKLNAVRYVAPIYVSSYCADACPYCNFSALRKATPRKRLTVEELEREVRAVMEEGARVIELVYATDPELDRDAFIEHVRSVRNVVGEMPGSGVLLCTGYLPLDAYEELFQAGLSGIVQWDETLDAGAYHRWHSSSPYKREFRTRMDNHDRAMAAGLDVATGALFGLADYRYDVLMQIAKARFLAAEYRRAPFVFGAPRLKPIGGRELRFSTGVSDREFETSLLVYSVAAPKVGRWLQTRETFAMNLRNMLDGDVFTYRCGDVKPGGYVGVEGNGSGSLNGQFGVSELERGAVEAELAAHEFQIDWAWMDERNGRA